MQKVTIGSIFSGFRYRVLTTLAENKDFRTNQHIVVFESDDWGSIRMPKRKGWEELLRKGFAVDKRPYERYDTLESTTDLEALFEVLMRYKDVNGHHPVITANMLMANPDFAKIEEAGYQEYFYEPIAKTYERYYGDSKVLDLMFQGYEEGLFMPQSHGREHFNVSQWLQGLQKGDKDLLTAFRYGVCGIAPQAQPQKGNQLMNALRAGNPQEQRMINQIVSEGLQMFTKQWGFKSDTFVAPCYCWDETTEQVLYEGGVKLMQAARVSKPAFESTSRYFHSGQVSKSGIIYSIRNCGFEPSTNENHKKVGQLMKQIDDTFQQHKIAVFSTHRINYVGGIDHSNRHFTLKVLDEFLTLLLQKYPDALFLSSDKLIDVL